MTWTQNDTQFWLAMARSIERGGQIVSYNGHRWGTKRDLFGLCWSLTEVYETTEMPPDQYFRLKAALGTMAPTRRWWAYWFPLNARGDARRATLCRRLARMAAKDGGNHGGAP